MLAALLAAGCATRSPAPVIERTPLTALPPPPAAAPVTAPVAVAPVIPTYTVKRGDTLRTIAQENGVNVRDLAAWNNLDNPNRLNVGQVLRLGSPSAVAEALPVPGPTDVSGPGVTTAPLRMPAPVTEARGDGPAVAGAPLVGPRTPDNYKSSPKAIKEPYSAEAVRDFGKLAAAAPSVAPDTTSAPPVVARAEPSAPPAGASPSVGGNDDRLDWTWPAKGRVVGAFSESANLKGIDIAGTAGTPVVASAAGKVVYAGSGLRGYGKLVIIKHNDTYLSAYAHNREIVVKEGDAVARGQKIAEMGNSDADQVKLHFEIRRLGKPMDPARYLPPPT
ncbi:MAG: peptidoglycan DD-metalloendopeptidase family protein [Betaproteobacteria bacterium]